MALIKGVNAAALLKGAAVLDLSDLDRQAKRILDDARAKAADILEQAQQEAQRLIGEADTVGYQQGLERGLVEGSEQGQREGRQQVITELKPQLESLAASWTAALKQWEADRQEMLLAAREDVLAFAVAMGEKIIFRTVEVDGTIVEDQLAEALSLLSKPSSVVISISPQDRNLVEEVLPDLLSAVHDCEHVTVRDDPSMTPGGCRVGIAGGEIDATIETQLERIVQTILPWMRQEEELLADVPGDIAADPYVGDIEEDSPGEESGDPGSGLSEQEDES